VRLPRRQGTRIERLHEVRAPRPPSRRSFIEKAPHEIRHVPDARVQELERAPVPRELVMHFIDGAHRALAEEALDAEFIGEESAGGEGARCVRTALVHREVTGASRVHPESGQGGWYPIGPSIPSVARRWCRLRDSAGPMCDTTGRA